jgi:hypothetical protein
VRRDFQPAFVWAAFLAGLTGAQFAFFQEGYAYWLLGGAALATVAIAVYLLWFHSPEPEARRLPDSSYATLLLGVGAATAAIGTAFGPWLWLPGLGLALLGSAGLARELRAERKMGEP